MFIFNQKKFVKTKQEMTDETMGFYRKRKNGVLLMDLAKEPLAFIVNNQYRERFIVTACRFNKQIRFMFSTDEPTEKLLGINGVSLVEQSTLIEKSLAQV
jgi:hypothetical protein